jgi:2-oxoglutarate ferredoxin oxidoreductase subunit beta
VVVEAADVDPGDLLVHDAHALDPSTAFALSRLSDATTLARSPIGVFRDVKRPAYDRQVNEQLVAARAGRGAGELGSLLAGSDTWVID